MAEVFGIGVGLEEGMLKLIVGCGLELLFFRVGEGGVIVGRLWR
jgi:hypothetical protein